MSRSVQPVFLNARLGEYGLPFVEVSAWVERSASGLTCGALMSRLAVA